jgi:hypothetical protein
VPYHPNLWAAHRPPRAASRLPLEIFCASDYEILKSQITNQIIPMPSIPIIMPQLGESIAEAKVISFLSSRRHRRSRPGFDRSRDEQGHDDRHVAVPRAHRKIHGPVGRKLRGRCRARTDRGHAGRTLARLGLDICLRRKPATRIVFPERRRVAGNTAFNRPCAACPCRPTPRAPATSRPGSRRGCTNSASTPPTSRALPAAARRAA